MKTSAKRPWLALYPEGIPAEAVVEHADGLAMFEHTLALRPDDPALWYFDAPITFRRLDELSHAFAAALSDRGIRHGDRVAAQLQNMPQMVVTMLATWKLGGILVPASAMAKERELTHVLVDSGSVALVTLETLWRDVARSVVDATAVTTVVTTSELDFLDGQEPPHSLKGVTRDQGPRTFDFCRLLLENAGRSVPRPVLDHGDPALLTFTSGTTGPAKGAINTHGNLVFSAQTYRDWVPLSADDVILGIAPLFHITGLVGHVAASLLTGAPLVLAYRFDPATFIELIDRRRATFTIGAITAFVAMMNSPALDSFDVSSLSKIMSGGAPIAPALADEVHRRFGTPLRSAYGLTETTSPSHLVPPGRRTPVDRGTGALSVGIPVSSTTAVVVDSDFREVAPGEAGEILIAGPQVVPGYWQNPKESDHALRDDGLRTGDIGFMNEDGWFFVIDRLKDQINASGFKVWPREVEDVLHMHPAVREAAVVGVEDEYRGESVKAFVSLRENADVTADELIAFCRDCIASYKCPRVVEFIDDLPKSASGKVLRRELRERA